MTDQVKNDDEVEAEIDGFLSELYESMFGPIDKDAPVYEGPPRWHTFDLNDQAIDGLRHIADLLPHFAEDPYLWKWVVIGMFDALLGFFGIALRRGDGAQLLVKDHEIRTYKRWHEERRLGKPIQQREIDRVDWTKSFYRKIQDPQRMRHLCGKQELAPTAKQDDAFEYLADLRDRLSHYGHEIRFTCVAELPELILDCLSIIEALINECRAIRLRPREHDAIGELVQRIRREAQGLMDQYELAPAATGLAEEPA